MADKTILLQAKIDPSSIGKAVQDLKAGLGQDISPGKLDLSGFKAEFEGLADSIKELVTALKQGRNATQQRTKDYTAKDEKGNPLWVKDSKGDYLKRKDVLGFESDSRQKAQKNTEIFLAKQAAANASKADQTDKTLIDTTKKDIEASKKLIQNIQTLNKILAKPPTEGEITNLLSSKSGTGGGRGLAVTSGGGMSDTQRLLFGSKQMYRRGGLVGAAGAGLLGGTLGGIDLLTQLTQREYQFGMDTAHGKSMEGYLRKTGRENVGAGTLGVVGGAVGAGATAFAMGLLINPIVAAVLGGLAAMGGGIGGGMAATQGWGEYKTAKAGPMLEAFDLAKSLRPSRLELMRGTAEGLGAGSTFDQLNAMQNRGTSLGFGLQETLSSGAAVKALLGGQNALGLTNKMQELYNFTGISPEQQAQNVDILGMGQSGSKKYAAGFEQQKRILEKAFATGMDKSRGGKALEQITTYLRGQANFAALDTEAISDRIISRTVGYAQGGEITNFDFERARKTEEYSKAESANLANVANWKDVFDVQKKTGVKFTTQQLMAAAGFSNAATPDQMAQGFQMTGMSPEDIAKVVPELQKTKQGLRYQKEAAMFGGRKNEILFKPSGMTTEDLVEMNAAEEQRKTQNLGPVKEIPSNINPWDSTSPEFYKTQEWQQSQLDAQAQQVQFDAAAKGFSQQIKVTQDGLVALTTSLTNAAKYINEEFSKKPWKPQDTPTNSFMKWGAPLTKDPNQ